MLDLGGAESHRSLWDRSGVDATILEGPEDPHLLWLLDHDERFDTVFSSFRLVAARDFAGTLSRIGRLLRDDGALLFLEPARRAGPTGRAQRAVAPAVALSTGWRLDRDVPGALRRAGLSVTDIERHRASTIQWWLREVVEGSAHPALPAHPGGG